MRRLYLIVPGQALTERLIGELKTAGLRPGDMTLYAQQPVRSATLTLPVKTLRPSTRRILLRALSGAVSIFFLVVLVVLLGGLAAGTGVLLGAALLGALLGGATAGWGLAPAEISQMRKELRSEDRVMLLNVPDERLGEFEQMITARHPEIRVKGTDPRGSPPFP